ncbi:MAG: hypothetical protein V4702_04870 [Patescibacteria group bacterium]
MSELPLASKPEGLNPGDVIGFADMPELMAFEDLLAPLVDPLSNAVLWQTRPKLSDLLRPPTFNGTIRDITLTAMDEPYERLLDAKDRGWTMPRPSGSFERTQLGFEQKVNRYLGFIFDAEAYSSGTGVKGRIAAELWYYPLPQLLKKAGSITVYTAVTKNGDVSTYTSVAKKDSYKTLKNRGEAIRRVVTKPRLDAERFLAAHDVACAIGFSVLRDAMRAVISTPMRD